MIETVASIWGENMHVDLSLDIICSSKLTVFLELCSQKTYSRLRTDNISGQISEHIFAQNGGFCLFIVT